VSIQKTITINPQNAATFVSQIVPTVMHPGHSYAVSLQFNNTGATTWTVANTYKLQSKNPNNNAIWGVNRIALSTDPTAPNANGTFSANVVSPSAAGTYNFQWQPIQDSIGTNFGPTSTNVSVSVTVLPDDATYVSRSGAVGVYASSDFYAQYTMKNVGSNSWTQGAGYSMMSVNPDNNTVWTINRLSIPNTATVANGQTVVATGLCHAPSTPGTYTMQWQMNRNGTKFGDPSPIQTITVYPAPNDAQFVSQAVPASIGPSKTFSPTFTFKNVGTSTWTSGAGYGLKSQNPAGNTTWGTASVPVSGSVSPGTNAVFTPTFTSPATPGTYHLQFKMAQNGNSFGQFGTDVTVVVSNDAAIFVSRTGPTNVYAGADFYVQYTMQNTGTTTWTQATNYSMLTVNAYGNTQWRANRIFIPAASTVTPGATVVLSGLLTAPTTPGTYAMQWQMVKTGATFGEQTPSTVMHVYQGVDNAVYLSQTGVPTTIAHGQTFNATITLQNTGTGSWSTGGGYSLKAQNPAGNTNWGVGSLPVTGTIAPNGNGVFTHTFTAPAAPGTYQFQWRMQHNTSGFGDFTTNVTITVT